MGATPGNEGGMEVDAATPATSTSKNPQIDQAKVEEGIANAKAQAAAGARQEAIQALLSIEQKGRLAEDITSTQRSCTAILEILHEARDWAGLQEMLLVISKRRSQLRQVIAACVRQVMGYLDDTPDVETKTAVIKTLLDLTEGKMYVEIERARLTRRLARMKEDAGDVAGAADVLQEVAVETFGAMSKTEKIAYILEQVRLCLDKQDFVKAQILAKKVSPRAFVVREGVKRGEGTGEIGIEGTVIEPSEPGTPSLEELKKKYYELMIRYYANERDYLEICRAYRAIYEEGDIETLKKICWYAVLSPRDSDQQTLLTNTAAESELDKVPEYKTLLSKFQTREILWWQTFSSDFEAEMNAQSGVFGGPDGDKVCQDLKLRVVEHNLSVVEGYYARITLSRLAQLLALEEDEAERRLCDAVSAGKLRAKLDRPAATVAFPEAGGEPGEPGSAALTGWVQGIERLLETVEKTCQKIQKESMVHRVPIGAA